MGRRVDDLQPHLAVAGQVVGMQADGQTPQEHAQVTDESGRPVFALPR